ncbi:MAG TPA: molybdopterin converting factor subunit 1 [Vicinamibacterales bacterium]|nr:molybdopterin converting factor subunit 1 [Vicinamibacterales bacterium]
MFVTVRLFARLREIVGGRDTHVKLPDGATARDLWSALVARYPELEPYTPSVSCAVNEDYARLSTPLQDGDDVAFLPPVSGG